MKHDYMSLFEQHTASSGGSKIFSHNMRYALLCIWITISTLCASDVVAQGALRGTVIDEETGEGLPGATVQVEGIPTKGTVTDLDGNFSIEIYPGDMLVFSSIGFVRQKVDVGDQTNITVTMALDVTSLDEVVVTAFGIEREEKNLGYAITELAGKELQVTREPNFVNALAGKVAGVVINSGTNGAGSATRVVIRGNASFGNNQPLYVVDGMPLDNTFRGTLDDGGAVNGGTDPGDGLANLNPDDIESISVLKGVSAAALYGNRAQGGVILITTKKGRKGEGLGITFNSNTVFEEMIPYDGFQEVYGSGYRGGLITELGAEIFRFAAAYSWGPRIDEVEEFVDFDGVTRPYELQSVEDNFARFFDAGVTTTNSLAFSGGGENSTYRFSLSNTYNTSPFPGNSNLKRYNVGFRGTSDIGTKFHADYKIDLSRTDRIGKNLLRGDLRGSVGRVFTRLSTTTDINLLRQTDEDEDYLSSGTQNNPWVGIERVQADDFRNRVIVNTKFTYDLTEELSVMVQGAIDRSDIDDILLVRPNNFSNESGLLSQNRQLIEESNVLSMFLYNKELSDVSISATAGVQHRSYKNSGFGAVGNDFIVPDLVDFSNVTIGSSTVLSSPDVRSEVNSVFGSSQIGYKNFLFLELTGRSDWASALSSIREGFFDNSLFYPSANLSFAFTDVFDFIPEVLSFGKLRAAWGQTGSDFTPHLTDLTFAITGSNNGNDNATISGSSLPPTSIKPETTTEIELGAQFNFFFNRLTMDFTYYDRETEDFLLSSSVSRATGFSSVFINAGRMSNKGIELLVTGQPVKTEDFTWDISVNMARNESKVLELTDELSETGVQHYQNIRSVPGRPFASIFGSPIRRGPNGELVYREIDADGDGTNDGVVYESGQVTYDAEGNPIRDENGAIIVDNQVYLGSGNPDLTGGLYNTFTYKNISLGVLIDGQFGASIYSSTHENASIFGGSETTLLGREGDYVPDGLVIRGDDSNPEFVENTLPFDPQSTYENNNPIATELHVFDNSFIRLRQIVLGYRLPAELLDVTPFKSASFSLIARNVLYLRKDVPIVDPGSADTIGNGFGYETTGLPTSRTYGFNLNLQF